MFSMWYLLVPCTINGQMPDPLAASDTTAGLSVNGRSRGRGLRAKAYSMSRVCPSQHVEHEP